MRGLSSMFNKFRGTKEEDENDSASAPPPLPTPRPLRVEFLFHHDMVGKIIGSKGATVQGITESSGARCYVHRANDDDPRTYMEAKGFVHQVYRLLSLLFLTLTRWVRSRRRLKS